MEKKRSVGVTTFGYFGLIVGIIAAIQDLLKFPNIDILKIFIDFVYIVVSYNLIKLNNWARIFLLIMNTIVFFIASISDLLCLISPGKSMEIFKNTFPHFTAIMFVFFIVFHIYLLGFFIYFTRPKVKALFSPER